MRGLTLDEIDVKLLTMLQADGRISQHDLAESVGLSSPATGERLRKLEDRGIIKGFTAIVDPKPLGFDVTAFIAVGLDGSRFYQDFLERVQAHPEIQECHTVTGQGSHLLKIRTGDTSTLPTVPLRHPRRHSRDRGGCCHRRRLACCRGPHCIAVFVPC